MVIVIIVVIVIVVVIIIIIVRAVALINLLFHFLSLAKQISEMAIMYDQRMEEEVEKMKQNLRTEFETEIEQQTSEFQQRILG